jgi:hypothetical protein
MDAHKDGTYEAPEVEDYGPLEDVTRATGLFGAEDGATKAIPFHHNPSTPEGP